MDARGRSNCEGRSHYNMAFKAIDQSNRFNYGRRHNNMAFYCQWPIKSFTEISVSLAFASNFFVNNSSRRSSRCPWTISLDDRDYPNVLSSRALAQHVLEHDYWFLQIANFRPACAHLTACARTRNLSAQTLVLLRVSFQVSAVKVRQYHGLL